MKRSLGIALVFALAFAAGCKKNYEKSLEIRKSLIPGAGNGVFATEYIPAGTCLGQYRGEYITNERHQELRRAQKWHYVMGLRDCSAKYTGGYTLIDGVNGNVFTRINYAPEEFQNTEFKFSCEPPFVVVMTIKDLRPGDELLIDYGPDYRYDFMEDPAVQGYFESLRNNRAK